MKSTRACLALTLLAVLLAGPARADNLDRKLADLGEKLLAHCRAGGYKSVGTLKFRVKLGKSAPSLAVEPLCSNMAERLETLLIASNEPKKPVAVLHAAGLVASEKDLRSTYRSAEGRKKLFGYSYPLAWGEDRRKADAFFTGQVDIPPDLKRARVTIECFDAKKAPAKVLSFDVDVDRGILADAGLYFALEARDLKTATPVKLDQQAVACAAKKLAEGITSSHLPAAALVECQVVLGGKAAAVRPSRTLPGEGTVPAPAPGQSLALKVKNLTKQRVGLVLKFGGSNTIDEENEEGLRARKWMLAPGKVYTITSYHSLDGKKTWPFRVAPVVASELAPALGDLIEVAAFVAGEKEDKRADISLRGFSKREWRTLDKRKLADLRDRLRDRVGISEFRLVRPPGPPDKEMARLPNPTFLEYRRVRLERPAKGSAGKR
jgi:hypothetical protein